MASPTLSFRKNYGPAETLQVLHESVECSLEKWLSTVVSGFTAILFDGIKYLFHIMIESYIADIPEAEDVFSLKWETWRKCLALDFKSPKTNLYREKDLKGEA